MSTSDEAMVRVSRALQNIARVLDVELAQVAGERVTFSLIVFTNPRFSYVSNSKDRAEIAGALQTALQQVTPEQVRRLVGGLAAELAAGDHRRIQGVLQSAVEAVRLDPVTLECRIRYRIPLERTLGVASPRRCDGWGTALRAESVVRVLLGTAA